MGFMDSYKHLEKLCGEMLCNDRRVSAYIDEMENIPRGNVCVSGWNEDLKQLKHYRWVRNQIVHDPNCSEENMCCSADTEWLDEFYSRIMNQTDPLALYRKATQARSASVQHKLSAQSHTYPVQPRPTHNNMPKNNAGCLTWLVAVLMVVLFVGCLLFL